MDALHDSSHRTWYHIGTQYEKLIPSYVMSSSPMDKEAADELSDSEYADDVNRMFPICSPEETWLSAAYIAKNAADFAERYSPGMQTYIRGRLEKAAAVWAVDTEIGAIQEAIGADLAEKTAADPDEDYGWVSATERKYPMRTPEGVEKASEYFSENRFMYPPAMRKTIARNIMRKSADFKVKVADCVRKEAGQGLPNRAVLMAELLRRADLTKDAEVGIVVANLNELIACADEQEIPEMLDKIAEIVDMLDSAEGWDRQYGRRMLSPADILYEVDCKEAEEALADRVELARCTFSAVKLAKLEKTVYSDVLGDDFCARVCGEDGNIDTTKLADELHSLPRPDKIALEDHLASLFKR